MIERVLVAVVAKYVCGKLVVERVLVAVVVKVSCQSAYDAIPSLDTDLFLSSCWHFFTLCTESHDYNREILHRVYVKRERQK